MNGTSRLPGFTPGKVPTHVPMVAHAKVEVTEAEVVAAAKLEAVSAQDLDHFLRERASGGIAGAATGLFASMRALLDGPAASEAAVKRSAELSAALTGLSVVYADQLMTTAELSAVASATEVLRDVVKLADPAVIAMLPRKTRERLETQLLEPARILIDAAAKRVATVREELLTHGQPVVDHRAVLRVVSRPITADSVPIPDALARYIATDPIAVPRSGGIVQGAVVDHCKMEDGSPGLLVEFPISDKELGRKRISAASVAKANPFKMGDTFDVDGRTVRVSGFGPYGGLVATVSRGPDEVHLGAWVPPGDPGDDILQQLRARWGGASSAAAASAGQAPPQLPSPILLAGGASLVEPMSYAGPGIRGAAFTNLGVNYKDYNEDAAALGAVQGTQATVGFAGVFDQAGGEGHSSIVGEASALAAQGLVGAAKRIADGAPVDATLREAIVALNAAVRALPNDQRTSFASGVMVTEDGQKMFVALNCGDSMVVHYAADGRVKGFTKPDSMSYDMEVAHKNPNLMIGGFVNSLLGVEPNELQHEIKRFRVAEGDFFLCLSDGAIDAYQNEHKRDVKAERPWAESGRTRALRTYGELVASHGADSAGCAAVARFALDRMQTVDGFWPAEPATADAKARPVRAGSPGKPDNISVVVVRG